MPNEEVDMPIFFFIDPEIIEDPRFDGVDEITLSYIFAQSNSPIPEELTQAFPNLTRVNDLDMSLPIHGVTTGV